MAAPLILAGPTGTRLMDLGFDVDAHPMWSARAVAEAPELVAQIHREYADAGADVHPAVTFRTTPRYSGDRWRELTEQAVTLCRTSLAPAQRAAGVVAPLGDCYDPAAAPTPVASRAAHLEMARALVASGCELICCETFPGEEGVWAAEAAASAGAAEVWVSFTPGPKADLLTPQEVAALAARAAEPADAVLVNCLPAWRALDYLSALTGAVGDMPVGIAANVYGSNAIRPEAYARLAAVWHGAGASIIGVCCGGGPGHVRALRQRLTQHDGGGYERSDEVS